MDLSQRRESRPGEYAVQRSADTPESRKDAKETLRRQGCKSVRFVTLVDGRLVAHGYLGNLAGAEAI